MIRFFWGKSDIYRTDETFGKPTHHYIYSLFLDSINLEYKGMDYIYVPAETFNIDINNETLTIQGFSDFYPNGGGDNFFKITNE